MLEIIAFKNSINIETGNEIPIIVTIYSTGKTCIKPIKQHDKY